MTRVAPASRIVTGESGRNTARPRADIGLEQRTVRAAVANLRHEPSHASELVSQLILGEPVRVLEHAEGWLRVAGMDGYEGWTEPGAVAIASIGPIPIQSLVWCRRTGLLREAPDVAASPVVDLVLGARAAAGNGERDGWSEVVLPDGGRAWAESEGWVRDDGLAGRFPLDPAAILATALGLRGVPYLWGGTSSKAFDCSGFVQCVLRLHGVPLPRDAWQQVEAGALVEAGDGGVGLERADLVFFAEEGRRVTHVGMALGQGGRIVHCSTSRASVAVDAIDPADPLYAPSLGRSLVSARRVL